MRDIHTFGCLVQYLKVGHDKEKRSNKFVSRTTSGVFLGMAGFLIFDPLRANLVVRTDVKFHDILIRRQQLMERPVVLRCACTFGDRWFYSARAA